MKMTTDISIYNKRAGEVIKSNYLVEAKYNLSLNEQKLILMAISRIDSNSPQKNVVSVSVRDFCNFIGSSTERYTEIRQIFRDLRKKEILITRYDDENEIKEEIITGWIGTLHYKEGNIDISFSAELMPYIAELRERYTVYNIINIANLNSKHAIRLYELIKEYEFRKNILFDYDYLKELICGADKFERYFDFKKRVLIPSQNEITSKCDTCFEFTEIRKGKKVVGIDFYIHKNKSVIEKRQEDMRKKEPLWYYGENNVELVVQKYNNKSKEELVTELQNLMINRYEKTVSQKELDTYSNKALMKVIFGIVEGTYSNVKAPISYFRAVLKKEEQYVSSS